MDGSGNGEVERRKLGPTGDSEAMGFARHFSRSKVTFFDKVTLKVVPFCVSFRAVIKTNVSVLNESI